MDIFLNWMELLSRKDISFADGQGI